MQANIVQENWAGGELSPKMRGRFTLPIYINGAERIVNFISEANGPLKFRTGFQYVHNCRRNAVTVLIPFQFSDQQSYLLAFSQGYIRVLRNNGILVETEKNIEGVDLTDPVTIHSTDHGYQNGDEVIISGVVGTTQLNGRSFVVANKTQHTYQLLDNDEDTIDGTSFDAWVSDGISEKVFEMTSPYLEEHLYQLKYAQNADVQYIVHREYEPRKLTRAGALSWSIATFTRVGDPFTGADLYPGAVAFYQGRIFYASSETFPNSFWASKALDEDGNPQYDDLTIGTDPADGFKNTLAPSTGRVDVIQSIVPTTNFLAMCTSDSIFKVDGGGQDTPISPTDIKADPAVNQGVLQEITPILLGNNLLFIHRSGRIFYSLEYDLIYNSYISVDKNLVNDHLTKSGIIQMVYQTARPSVVWMTRNDGLLIGDTFVPKENIAGGHRHPVGGENPKVLSVGVMPRLNDYDQLWAVIERRICGLNVQRTIEVLNDDVEVPERDDYYSGDENESEDDADWRRDMWYAQKRMIHLDSALSYDNPITITGVTLTSPPVVTAPGHGLAQGAKISIDNLAGAEELNGRNFIVSNPTTDTFELFEVE